MYCIHVVLLDGRVRRYVHVLVPVDGVLADEGGVRALQRGGGVAVAVAVGHHVDLSPPRNFSFLNCFVDMFSTRKIPLPK